MMIQVWSSSVYLHLNWRNVRDSSTPSAHWVLSSTPNIKVKWMWPVLKTFAHNYVGPLSALPADSIEGMSKTPVPCQPIGSLVPSLIKVKRLRPVLKTFGHNYIGQGCTLSALPAHLIGGMSGTPVPLQPIGSLAPPLILK